MEAAPCLQPWGCGALWDSSSWHGLSLVLHICTQDTESPHPILFFLNRSTFYLHVEGGVCLDNRGLETEIICAGFIGLPPWSRLSLPGMT